VTGLLFRSDAFRWITVDDRSSPRYNADRAEEPGGKSYGIN
jgi:hypothetical protein